MKRWLAALWLLAVPVFAETPYLPIDANFERHDSQFHIYTKVGNTPVIRAYFYQGTNTWNGTNAPGWRAQFKYGANNSATQMVTITGTVYGVYADFPATTNSFAKPVSDWYAAILLTNGSNPNLTISQPEGMITVERSPEIDSGTLAFDRSLNGSLYTTFLGSFAAWPFISTNSIVFSNYVTWGAVTDAYARAQAAIGLTNFQGYLNAGLAGSSNYTDGVGNISKTNQHNEFVTWLNVTDGVARATANVALTNAHNEFTPWGYATDATARASAAVALTNGHDTLLDLAGTRTMTGDLISNSRVISNVIARVRNDYLIDYWSDNIYRLMGYQSPAQGTGLGSGVVALLNDWLGLHLGTNVQFGGSTFWFDLAGSVITNGSYYGNGSGLTGLQYAASAGVAALATNTPFWSGVGSMYVTESANHETSILYHVTTTFATNKIGEFRSVP